MVDELGQPCPSSLRGFLCVRQRGEGSHSAWGKRSGLQRLKFTGSYLLQSHFVDSGVVGCVAPDRGCPAVTIPGREGDMSCGEPSGASA